MKFVITETVPCVQQWTYEVEAASETEALEMILNGKGELIDSVVTDYDYEQTSFEIEYDDMVGLERGEIELEGDVENEELDNTQDDNDCGCS